MPEKILTTDGHTLSYVWEEADGAPVAHVIMCHGLMADKDEYEGLHRRTAERLTKERFNVLRFDYRGHGASQIPSDRMTIQGEFDDLRAAHSFAASRGDLPVLLIATSFGALSAVRLAADGASDLHALALWNPVVNACGTFIRPGTAWSRTAINERTQQQLADGEADHVVLDGFKLGRDLVEEMERTDLGGVLAGLRLPVFAAHGTADQLVPFHYTAEAMASAAQGTLLSLPGAGHGFLEHQADVIDATVQWLLSVAVPGKAG
ncbi:alpha/beta hydrolase [Streptomyces sp. NPDC055287]